MTLVEFSLVLLSTVIAPLSPSQFLLHNQQFDLYPSTEEFLKAHANLSYLAIAIKQHISGILQITVTESGECVQKKRSPKFCLGESFSGDADEPIK